MPYRWCIVPLCKSTSICTPNKVFVSVPKGEKRRKMWLKAIRRDDSKKKLSMTTTLFVCEDHFDMENDMENYMRFTMVGGNLRSKNNIVPHKFDCQPREIAHSANPRKYILKKEKMEVWREAINSSHCKAIEVETSAISGGDDIDKNGDTDDAAKKINQCEVGSQTSGPHFRSKEVMCNPIRMGLCVNQKTSPMKNNSCDAAVSPMKCCTSVDDVFTDSSSEEERQPDSDWRGDSCSSDSVDGDEDASVKALSLRCTTYKIKKNPRNYLGIEEDSLFVIDLLCKEIEFNSKFLSKEQLIFLILWKIRQNMSFCNLADSFGISRSYASKLFEKFLPPIAECIKQLIVWPSVNSLQDNLPLSFQARYSNIQSIIDCFKIEIEKPSNALHQSLTWSEYKKCNTIKFLISATPDGIINFVSRGYGGRVSDLILLQNCGYLDHVPAGTGVLADRGFKHIEGILRDKGCHLTRPASVACNEKLSKSKTKETKRIASLRIHMERVIRRVREFNMLAPHSCLDSWSMRYIDSCILIAAGLINLQGPLIM